MILVGDVGKDAPTWERIAVQHTFGNRVSNSRKLRAINDVRRSDDQSFAAFVVLSRWGPAKIIDEVNIM